MLEIIKAYWNLRDAESCIKGAKSVWLLVNDTINYKYCIEILDDIARLKKIIWRKPRMAKKVNEEVRLFKNLWV